MLARWRAAGLIWPTLMTLAMLPVLISLGTWQLHRKAWKEDLIAKIEARRVAEPVSYTAALSEFVKTGDVDYTRIRLSGTFDHAEERHLYAPHTDLQGWNVYTLFKPDGGQPPLFVNRGWVPDSLKDPAKRAEGQTAGTVTVTGLARLDQTKNTFTPDNDAKTNRWYARDTWAMRWGAEGEPSPEQLATMRLQGYAPFSLDVEAEPANPGGWPKGGTTEIRLSNSHLQYVVTWYGLAATLSVIFAIYARQRLAALSETPVQP
jgi:surfeit locus 1 family protein